MTLYVQLLAEWILISMVLCGVGFLAARAFKTDSDVLESWWLGLAVTLISLQWWHLLFAVDGRAFALWVLFAVYGWWMHTRLTWAQWKRLDVRALVVGVMLCLVALWLSTRAMGPIRNDDSGVYHLGAIRWAIEYPAVPGIGNVHPFLAVNHGFFLFEALLGAAPFGIPVQHVANGLIVLGLVGLALRGLARLVRRSPWTPSAAAEAMLLPWAVFVAQSVDVASATSDLCEIALGAAFVSRWAKLLDPPRDPERQRASLLTAFLFAVALVVVKLSAAGALLGTCLGAFLLVGDQRRRVLLACGGIGLGAGIPWSIGCIVRSGYLPYPGAVLAFPVDWRVPRPVVEAVQNWTLAYGRGNSFYWDRQSGWAWMPAKIELLLTHYRGWVIPLGLTALLLVLAVVIRAPWKTMLAMVAPALGGLAFWLLTSPNERYAGIWAQATAALSAAAVLAHLRPRVSQWLVVGVLSIALLRAADLLAELDFRVGREIELQAPVAKGQWEVVGRSIRAFVVKDELCWEAPLPCISHPDPALDLREPGNLGAGFKLSVDLEQYRPATLNLFPAPTK